MVVPSRDLFAGHLNDSAGPVYDTSLKFRLFAEELDAIHGRLVDARYTVNAWSIATGGVERIDEFGAAILRTILPEVDLSYDLGSPTFQWGSVYAGFFVGDGSGLTGIGSSFDLISSGTNTTAAMVISTGASLAVSGSGTIAATSAPFAGLTAGTNTAALVIGAGGSLGRSGGGTIDASSLLGVTWAAPGTIGGTTQAQMNAANIHYGQNGVSFPIYIDGISGGGYLGMGSGTKIKFATSSDPDGATFDATIYRNGTRGLTLGDGSSGYKEFSVGGIAVAEGSNCRMGSATLVAGAVTVNTNKVTANSRIFLTISSATAPLAVVYEDKASRVNGTSFVIKSLNVLDVTDVEWLIMEPA